MAELRVHQWMGEGQTDVGIDWEEDSYREGCAYACELAGHRLEALDNELMRSRPKGLRPLGFRHRTLMTRFGEVSVGRRMCRGSDGQRVLPLDEYLGWKPKHLASPSIDREGR